MTKQDMIELARKRKAYRQTKEYQHAKQRRESEALEALEKEKTDIGSVNHD